MGETDKNLRRRWIFLFGAVPPLLGLTALAGWCLRVPVLASLVPNRIPMAPSTALFFILFGAMLIVWAAPQRRHGVKNALAAVLSALVAASALLLVTSLMGIQFPVERLGFAEWPLFGAMAVGHMSPVTALCFLLTGMAFLSVLGPPPLPRRRVVLSLCLSGPLLIAASVMLLAYLYGVPLFYIGAFIPPAAPTCAAFAALGMALGLLAFPRLEWDGKSPEPVDRTLAAMLAVFVLLAFGIISAGYVFYQYFDRQHRASVAGNLSSIAELRIREITQWRQERLGDATTFMDNRAFARLVRRHFDNPADLTAEEELREWLKNVREAFNYERLYLVDPEGVQRMTEPPEDSPSPPHYSQDISQALAAHEPILVDFHRGALIGAIHLTALAPVYDAEAPHHPLAVMAFRINPAIRLYPMLSDWPTPSTTGETMLVRREGDEMLALTEPRRLPGGQLTLRNPLRDTDIPAVRAVLGDLDLEVGLNYLNIPVVADVRPVPGSPWTLVTMVDLAEVLAPLTMRLWGLVLLVGTLILLSASGIGLIWRQQRLRFHLERHAIAEALLRSEEGHRTTLMSVGDAVIATDTEGRITVMNPVAERLTGWPLRDALGRPLSEVFHIINERTRETVESPVAIVMREGGVVGLANHTVLIARDGGEVPIADSGAPIFGEDGGISGVVLVFRDQTKEHAAQRALRESEARFRNVFDNSISAIALCEMVFDGQGNPVDYVHLELNPAFAEHTGIPVAQAEGRRMTELFPDGNAAPFIRAFGNVILTGKPAIFEQYFDALNRHFSLSAFSVGGLRFAVVFQDITDRMLAAEKTARDEARLQTLVEILQHPATDRQTFLDYALEKAIELTESRLGYIYMYDEERREFVLNSWSKDVMAECAVANPESCYALDKTGIWGEAVRQRRPIIVNDFEAENPLKKGYPEGHVHLKTFLTVPVVRGEVIAGVVGVANREKGYEYSDVLQLSLLMDAVWRVVERLDAENELRKVSAAVEQSTVAVEITDLRGNIEYVNPRFTEMTGYTLEEARGQNPRMLKSGETPPETYRELWGVISAGGEWRGEFHNRRKDGTLYWEQADISPIRDASGAVTHYLGIKTDITKQRELEEQLRQSQKMEAVGRLAGGVAHDFNNMLQAILGYNEMAREEVPPDSTVGGCLKEIDKAARRSAELTRQLLAFARRQTIIPRVVDLNEAVEGMLSMLRRLIGEHLDLLWKPAPNAGRVLIDSSQLDQILANLLVNARDAISGAGKITMETGRARFDVAYCASHSGFVPGSYAMLAVSDNGCGMDKQTLAKIFEPFFTTKGVGQGTGLGLSTVYGIVRQNDGFINVYSEPGVGSTFKLYLPLHGAEVEDIQEAIESGEVCGGVETILMVEDEESLLALAQRVLSRLGYTVLAANSPGQALELAAGHPGQIHLLATDVVMPEMSGRELLHRLLPLRPGIRSLFMSGYTANAIAHHGVLDKGVHFLQKPFTIQLFAQKVREVLDGE
ncbi:MAG: PAS domain S-box protein [Candidatus Hydrogenedentes bacterium]|nr:PAS domain S-box protein [Candidatus Hydrogenedentota bacterium]